MNGVINVIKPPGMSSSGVVVLLKGLFKQKKIGHAGTLDPGAAGVLPVLVGRSTKLSDILMSQGKEYIAEITFGISTDTLDSYGSIIDKVDCDVNEKDFINALAYFKGDIQQVPPVYSAVKIDGIASYKLARNGSPKVKPPRTVTIYDTEYLSKTNKNKFLFRISCSKGTYIRVIAEEIGKKLHLPAHMSFLLRTQSGGMRLENAFTIDEIKNYVEIGEFSFIQPSDSIDFGFENIIVDDNESTKLKNGVAVPIISEDKLNVYVYHYDIFLGIGEVVGGMLKLKISLYD